MEYPHVLATKKSQPASATRLAAVQAGQLAEASALRYLQTQGLQPLAQNFRCKSGELDLIMKQGEIIVFIEVKYRRNKDYGGALLSLSYRQQQRIIRSAQYYLMRHAPYSQARFDVIAVEGNDNIQWIPNAFDAG